MPMPGGGWRHPRRENSERPAGPVRTLTREEVPAIIQACCRALEDKKAGDLRLLHVAGLSTITDWLIIATGTSGPHLRAMRVMLERTLAETNTQLVGSEEDSESGWVVADAFDFMVHMFTSEQREHYSLEQYWRDAPSLSW